MSADAHDAALATVSHLPHIVASQLAAQLATTDDATVGLGGTGLQDTTRVAAGDPELWTQILAANAAHLAVALAKFSADVQATVADLQRIAAGDAAALGAVQATTFAQGVAGRARVPVKRGLAGGRVSDRPDCRARRPRRTCCGAAGAGRGGDQRGGRAGRA